MACSAMDRVLLEIKRIHRVSVSILHVGSGTAGGSTTNEQEQMATRRRRATRLGELGPTPRARPVRRAG